MTKTPQLWKHPEWRPLRLSLNRLVSGETTQYFDQSQILEPSAAIIGKVISFLEDIPRRPDLSFPLMRLRYTGVIELVMPAAGSAAPPKVKTFGKTRLVVEDGGTRDRGFHSAWVDTRSRVMDCLVCMLRYRAFIKQLIKAEQMSDDELRAMETPLQHYSRNWLVVKEMFGTSYKARYDALMRRIAISEVHTPETQPVVTDVEQELELPVT